MNDDFLRELKQPVDHPTSRRYNYMLRDGFIFTMGDIPRVYDNLIVRNPYDAEVYSPIWGKSERSTEEHIQLINKYQLEHVTVICNDLSFITRCPSIKTLSVHPSDDAGESFDYSPLYQMPNLRDVMLTMSSGRFDDYWYSVDYSKIKGLTDIGACGKGNNGYELVPTLEKLWISNSKKHLDLKNISCSKKLWKLTMMCCNVKTLDGIEQYPEIKYVNMDMNRSLHDISALRHAAGTLTSLCIEVCPKVKDFSVLNTLVNLEYLQLHGSNSLPNLEFLQHMPKLKVFNFTMNVEDGDLTNCMNIPYATCKNRKHYNLKDSQLPKTRPQR